MKTLKLISFVLLSLFPLGVMGQQEVSVSQLNGTKWRLPNSTSGSTYEYTATHRIWRRNGNLMFRYPYYLSNTVVQSFDKSKVGKNTKGCYLVMYNEKLNFTYCSLIIDFDKQKGTIKCKLETKGIVGGSDIYTCELVR